MRTRPTALDAAVDHPGGAQSDARGPGTGRSGSLTANVMTVADALRDPRLRIPEYQRPYTWSTTNTGQLVEDIRRFRAAASYRIGTMIVHAEDGWLDIVDGQQRYMTFALIALALQEVLGDTAERAEHQRAAVAQVLLQLEERLLRRDDVAAVAVHEHQPASGRHRHTATDVVQHGQHGVGGPLLPNEELSSGRMTHVTNRPATRPRVPNFSSGPCTKRPGWSLEALADALLSPDKPSWRVATMSDAAAARVTRLAVGIAIVITVVKSIEALNSGISAALPISIATRGIGALATALILAIGLLVVVYAHGYLARSEPTALGARQPQPAATTAPPSQAPSALAMLSAAWLPAAPSVRAGPATDMSRSCSASTKTDALADARKTAADTTITEPAPSATRTSVSASETEPPTTVPSTERSTRRPPTTVPMTLPTPKTSRKIGTDDGLTPVSCRNVGEM